MVAERTLKYLADLPHLEAEHHRFKLRHHGASGKIPQIAIVFRTVRKAPHGGFEAQAGHQSRVDLLHLSIGRLHIQYGAAWDAFHNVSRAHAFRLAKRVRVRLKMRARFRVRGKRHVMANGVQQAIDAHPPLHILPNLFFGDAGFAQARLIRLS